MGGKRGRATGGAGGYGRGHWNPSSDACGPAWPVLARQRSGRTLTCGHQPPDAVPVEGGAGRWRPRCHVHCTPTYATWLNQVERWFVNHSPGRHAIVLIVTAVLETMSVFRFTPLTFAQLTFGSAPAVNSRKSAVRSPNRTKRIQKLAKDRINFEIIFATSRRRVCPEDARIVAYDDAVDRHLRHAVRVNLAYQAVSGHGEKIICG